MEDTFMKIDKMIKVEISIGLIPALTLKSDWDAIRTNGKERKKMYFGIKIGVNNKE